MLVFFIYIYIYDIKETKPLEDTGYYVEVKRIKATVRVEESLIKISARIEMVFSISWKTRKHIT